MTREELLQRYAAGERGFRGADLIAANLSKASLTRADLSGADLSGADLSGAHLIGANLSKANLSGADLGGADLSGTNLSKANLSKANLSKAGLIMANLLGADLGGADLGGANLLGADLGGANLLGADLSGANLSRAHLSKASLIRATLEGATLEGATLEGATLEGATLEGTIVRSVDLSTTIMTELGPRTGCRLDIVTFQRSLWSTANLVEWHRAGAIFEDFVQLPEDARREILGKLDGLNLCFHTRLSPVDRFLVDGVIFGVLGMDTDCQVVEFKQGEGSATVRLQASRRDDLERVAEALYQQIWEQQERAQALMLKNQLLGHDAHGALSDLRQRLDRVELRLNEKQLWSWDIAQDRLQLARPIRLFLSYAQEDDQLRRHLEDHLTTLKRQGAIECWHAGLLLGGDLSQAELRRQLNSADVVLVLVSANLLRSDALFQELQRALARHASGDARVIPIRVRPVDLVDTPLEALQALPDGGRPVTSWENQDAAWLNVAIGIRWVVREMVGSSGKPAPQLIQPA